MDALFSMLSFDTTDIVVLTILAAGGIWAYFKFYNEPSPKSNGVANFTPIQSMRQQRDTSFISRMKTEGRQVSFFKMMR